ncbi:MAG: phosphohydrolase [Bacteroidetes bacterium HGW-Bacteroidetes-21]|nr:MAG: phosphohydrolase [Bacteroidetes bacterium HGW-Bacteroidetes-21]
MTSFPHKQKILNDPVYGFIDMPTGINLEIVEHPWFQRLRHIRQLGLTFMVYPGAIHTRFQHVIGAYYLINQAISEIRKKGFDISPAEEEALGTAILLHDIGHGPFSHALEYSLLDGVSHEVISQAIMQKLNGMYEGKLSMAIDIFRNQYHRLFLHQLISSQLDMDRLDYLKRDSFFTGVSEGIIGTERIIKMLTVHNDNLVVEAKGIYSIEKFLIARRLMYWQVYLHKTVLSSEQLLIKIIKRARQLIHNGQSLFAPPALSYFLSHPIAASEFISENKVFEGKTAIELFNAIDDNDIFTSVKVWQSSNDIVLSTLCKMLMERRLLKIEMQRNSFNKDIVTQQKKEVAQHMKISEEDAEYFVFTEKTTHYAYNPDDERINILHKNDDLQDISEASDILNISVLSKNVIKHFFCYPKL